MTISKEAVQHNWSWFLYFISHGFMEKEKKKKVFSAFSATIIYIQTNKQKAIVQRMPGTDIFPLLHLSQQCALSLVAVILSIVRLGFH